MGKEMVGFYFHLLLATLSFPIEMALVFNVFSFEIRRQLLKLILFEVSRRFVGAKMVFFTIHMFTIFIYLLRIFRKSRKTTVHIVTVGAVFYIYKKD